MATPFGGRWSTLLQRSTSWPVVEQRRPVGAEPVVHEGGTPELWSTELVLSSGRTAAVAPRTLLPPDAAAGLVSCRVDASPGHMVMDFPASLSDRSYSNWSTNFRDLSQLKEIWGPRLFKRSGIAQAPVTGGPGRVSSLLAAVELPDDDCLLYTSPSPRD